MNFSSFEKIDSLLEAEILKILKENLAGVHLHVRYEGTILFEEFVITLIERTGCNKEEIGSAISSLHDKKLATARGNTVGLWLLLRITTEGLLALEYSESA